MPQSLRLVVFDATDVGRFQSATLAGNAEPPDGTSRRLLGLSPIWRSGTRLYTAFRAADASLGVRSWTEAIQWATDTARRRSLPISSLQCWGHGGWGHMQLGSESLDSRALGRNHSLTRSIDELQKHLIGPDALLWLRCCSAFGHHGRTFARALADRMGCRVAGHTHIIGFFQSGTHSIGPGEEPTWDASEGVRFEKGEPAGALGSWPVAPNTITCLTPSLPIGM